MTPEDMTRWWQGRSGLIILVIMFALPLAIGSFPPLIDLPTHMARYHIALSLAESPDLARYFSFGWRFLPNLGVDLLVAALAPMIGVEPATRIIVSLIPALTAAGMMGIARAGSTQKRGGALPAIAFFALPLAFSYSLTFGFVNQCLAVALAFITFAIWLRLDGMHRVGASALVAGLAAPIILTAHILGYGVFGVTILGASIGRAIEERIPWPLAAWRALLACLPAVWPLAMLSLWSTGTAPPMSGWLDWQTKFNWLAGLLRDHLMPLDLACAALLYGLMTLPLIRPRGFAYAPRVAIPALLLWILALGLPTTLITQFASVRLIAVASALTLLSIRARDRESSWLATAGLAFVALRLLSVTISSYHADRRIDLELGALDHVARGSRVIAFEAIDCERRWPPARLSHIPSLATVRRDAFVNDQFVTSEGQLLKIRNDQPVLKQHTSAIVFKSPCGRWGGLPTLSQALGHLPWSDMDYLWLIDAPSQARPSDRRLHAIWQNDRSILYRVRHPEGDAAHP